VSRIRLLMPRMHVHVHARSFAFLLGCTFFNLVLGRGGRGVVERFVRLVEYEDEVQRGPNLAPEAAYVSS
jgi:hypothetical protein